MLPGVTRHFGSFKHHPPSPSWPRWGWSDLSFCCSWLLTTDSPSQSVAISRLGLHDTMFCECDLDPCVSSVSSDNDSTVSVSNEALPYPCWDRTESQITQNDLSYSPTRGSVLWLSLSSLLWCQVQRRPDNGTGLQDTCIWPYSFACGSHWPGHHTSPFSSQRSPQTELLSQISQQLPVLCWVEEPWCCLGWFGWFVSCSNKANDQLWQQVMAKAVDSVMVLSTPPQMLNFTQCL